MIYKTKDNKLIFIDSKDYKRIKKYNWYVRKSGYIQGCINAKNVYLHRFIMNPLQNFNIDHINRNKLDNRKKNLRICTQSQNRYNSVKKVNSFSGYKGVTWHKASKKWRACIGYNKKHLHLGLFNNKKDAAYAYNKMALNLCGEFARLN